MNSIASLSPENQHEHYVDNKFIMDNELVNNTKVVRQSEYTNSRQTMCGEIREDQLCNEGSTETVGDEKHSNFLGKFITNFIIIGQWGNRKLGDWSSV